eukprot:TRINITY_DN3575_c0_g1_i2.p1 TRINITY_DN3575_c0_g1~~TRINITY_DN3575_c0_g1_i2.p1  ORF type:complete len:523 (+),score=113.62 TRINITY_DN3575_c0_g1_i2:24-1571(+)
MQRPRLPSVSENLTPGSSKESEPKSPKGNSGPFSFRPLRSLGVGAQNLLSGLSRVASPKSGSRVAPAVDDNMGAVTTGCCTVSETQVKEVHVNNGDSVSRSSTGAAGSASAPPSASSSSSAPPTAEAKALAAPGGSIAARRGFKPTMGVALNIDTKKDKKKKKERRRIKTIDSVSSVYELGKQVMPSSHSGMSVIFGKRLADDLEVVIKVRAKNNSFCDKAEENEWRRSTEFMMNLPETDGIAKVYEVLEDKKGYYVIMEKVHGEDLFETCTGKGLLPVAEVKEVLRQLLQALQELHSRNCIHKDLKLENIMFDRTPPPNAKADWSMMDAGEKHSPVQVKLIDFDTVENIVPQTPKKAQDVLGTDQYIAQEAYDGNYSPASDIFAAGVIGYRLLTSKFPFKSEIFNDEAGENWVGSPKMKEIRAKLCKFKIDWSHRVFTVEPHAKELLQAMLAVNDQHRPTAEEALGHPWLVLRQRRRSMPNLGDVSLPAAASPQSAAPSGRRQSVSGFERQASG